MGTDNQPLSKEELDKLAKSYPAPEESGGTRTTMIVVGIIVVVLIILIVIGIILLVRAGPTVTAQVRDLFIIFMGLMSLLLMLVLSLLVIQLARLINLLQNEIKPILESTNETVSTLRGTTTFISDNLVQPIIKLNEYLAAFQQMRNIIRVGRKQEKSNNHPNRKES